ncbi:hypothetical protein [Gordonia sp. (in: high G+C Gram-positive bacteria)]|jgi:hypothetical protein|uniref:hypothetical protein n=1 Tax=Gordonia sp. (in: high G+C Gram-positive bacteria) TaxID=84139 RepID=UPI001D8DECD5|nr:hypothetical protein [Gordonia sp. (in: high G+C Gram-positive bacteria)]MCB1297095.1 hypothetical protein [Gordonia sp. (in: high G+C Gram-positive bacteria)]HMS74138.1 hypothetical protein [Gordonia sp. (in: high G+C Gram-positive bacteria)]HQV17791.1 hypothetical protein [Gordonia sp. (in: high G+C Gram-positive bacteria)]
MSETHTTFVDACLAGRADREDIDDWVDRWHDGEGPDLSLYEFLGFTPHETRLWLKDSRTLGAIISGRRSLHLVYTDYGPDYAMSLRSPQIPGLVGGRRTATELLRDTDAILGFAGATRRMHDPGVHVHEQHAMTDPNGNEYLIRWAVFRDDSDSREATASRVAGSVADGYPEDIRLRQPQLITGERLLIAVEPSDTVEWIADQFGPGGCAVLCHAEGDMVWSIPLADGALVGGNTLDRLGLSRGSTFTQMKDAVLSAEVADLHDIEQRAGTELRFERGMARA